MAGEIVLYVEDSPLNVKLVEAVLRGEGFVLHHAAEGLRALEQVAALGPDLILMDVQLPDIDGLELTHVLRTLPGLEDTVIIALSANAMRGDEERAIAAGCDGYITKPFDVLTFAATLRTFLERGRRRPVRADR